MNSSALLKVGRARYIISENRWDFNTLVAWFIYTERWWWLGGISDLPQFIDTALLENEDNEYQTYLDEGFNYTVKDAVENGQLPKGNYRVARVFSIQDTGYSYPYGYSYLVKLSKDSKRKCYRARIIVWVTESEDQVFPPEYVI